MRRWLVDEKATTLLALFLKLVAPADILQTTKTVVIGGCDG